MRWELKDRALERGITTSAALRRILAAHGLAVSAGKMSGLWSTTPLTVRLEDLEVICTALACQPCDLLVLQQHPASHGAPAEEHQPGSVAPPAAGGWPGGAGPGGQPPSEPATAVAGRHWQTASARRRPRQRPVPPL